MKIIITNYTFDVSERSITFDDYVSEGIELERVLLIVNAKTNKILYNVVDTSLRATIPDDDNVLVLNEDTDLTGMLDADPLLIMYEDPNANQRITMGTGLREDYDAVTTHEIGSSPINKTASGIILDQPGVLVGAIVHSTSSGIIKIWDNASAPSGNVILDTFTPSVGPLDLFRAKALLGAYFQLVSGSINITFYTRTTT